MELDTFLFQDMVTYRYIFQRYILFQTIEQHAVEWSVNPWHQKHTQRRIVFMNGIRNIATGAPFILFNNKLFTLYRMSD